MKFKKALSLLLCLILIAGISAMPAYADNAESKNPVIEGYFADPDIDLFDCKYWMFPTTDGVTYPGWWGASEFHAFSSDDMVSWNDEGIILDVAADSAEEAGVNENGVQIAYSPWSDGYAWAPSIEKYGDMYYFYYVASVKPELQSKYCFRLIENEGTAEQKIIYDDIKAIGVAYASNPAGPYTALDEPIITSKMIYEELGIKYQLYNGRELYSNIIDPSIFVDDDGTPYMCLGNTVPLLVELNKDMLSINKKGVIKRLDTIPKCGAPQGFMEALVVFKRNDLYYFTWSVSGTSDPNYHVSYGVSDSLTGKITSKGELLIKDEQQNILGTGHHSILYVPANDTYYINYHRLCLDENGEIIKPEGNFREVCIDKIEFDAEGNASSVPTHTGVGPVSPHHCKLVSEKPATVNESGYRLYSCDCGEVSNKEIIPQLPAPTESTAPTQPSTTKQEATTSTTTTTAKAETTTTAAVKKPSVPKGLTLKKGSKSFTASYKKVSGVTGYQLQYSTDKNFKKGNKTVTLKGQKKTSTTVKKLKSKKTYYVRVRSYKTSGGSKTYSAWSTKKSVKVK